MSRDRGAGTVQTGARQLVPPDAPDPQATLLLELLEVTAQTRPSVQDILDLVHLHAAEAVVLTKIAVYVRKSEQLTRAPVALTGADSPGASHEERSVPLRLCGQLVGVLQLVGDDLDLLRPETLAGVAHHVAVALRLTADEQDRQDAARAARAERRLLTEGAFASSVELAGEILARVTAEAFGTEHAAVHLVDDEGRIRHVLGVGSTATVSKALQRSLIGRLAQDSPVWRSTQRANGPVLIDDACLTPARAGGFIQTMQLRSYIAMPLLSATGMVGMGMCGDTTRTRAWSERDREIARQLARQGAVIIDSARLRHAAQVRLTGLTHLAFHDPLTGLPNRSLLMDRIGRAVTSAARCGDPATLLLIDLDGFKRVNDTLGHLAGDVLLQLVADRLSGTTRAGDLVARLGGDEFAVLLGGDTDVPTSTSIATRFHDTFREPFMIEGQQLSIGAGIGLAQVPAHATDVASLIRAADNAMYQSKRYRNGPRLAEPLNGGAGHVQDRDGRGRPNAHGDAAVG